jgi:peptide-methionine (S)-S-oxide reductase
MAVVAATLGVLTVGLYVAYRHQTSTADAPTLPPSSTKPPSPKAFSKQPQADVSDVSEVPDAPASVERATSDDVFHSCPNSPAAAPKEALKALDTTIPAHDLDEGEGDAASLGSPSRYLGKTVPKRRLSATMQEKVAMFNRSSSVDSIPSPENFKRRGSSSFGAENKENTSEHPNPPASVSSPPVMKKRYDPSAARKANESRYLKAHFAAGCFWSVELVFQRTVGVISTTVGYTQGKINNPTYDDVKTGTSGHCECVEVTYDPELTTFEALLEVFWNKHDATSLNKQGNDKGTQYRSGLYYFSDAQRMSCETSIEEQRSKLKKPWHKIHTELKPAAEFYAAEDFHQKYLSEKGGRHGKAQSAAKGCSDPIRCYG